MDRLETPDRARVIRMAEIENRLRSIEAAVEADWEKRKPRALNLNEYRKRLAKINSRRRKSKLLRVA